MHNLMVLTSLSDQHATETTLVKTNRLCYTNLNVVIFSISNFAASKNRAVDDNVPENNALKWYSNSKVQRNNFY